MVGGSVASKKPKLKELRLVLRDVKMVKADGILIGHVKRGGRKYRTIMVPLDGLKEAKEN